jgi:SAM-dependent methyltransferase
LANGFISPEHLDEPEYVYPVNVYFCKECGLLQLADIVQKETLFAEYPYFSSMSRTFVEHSNQLAEEIVTRFKAENSLVVEIGSNDGVLLKPLASRGAQALGVEPATNIAKVANAAGIDTINDFFGLKVASKIASDRGKAKVIVACNVFNHLDDLDEVMAGIGLLLSEDGIFIVEVPYLADLMNNNAFDTMYHEMHSFFALGPLDQLFDRFGMRIFEARSLSLHTGSIRVYVKRKQSDIPISDSVGRMAEVEKRMGLGVASSYIQFAKMVEDTRSKLRELLYTLKKEHHRIVGYGAPAKGNVLLN